MTPNGKPEETDSTIRKKTNLNLCIAKIPMSKVKETISRGKRICGSHLRGLI